MSFGFSVGDFVAVAELCERLWKEVVVVARGAPKELSGLDKELAQLNQILSWLKDEVRDPESLISRSGPERVRMINETRVGVSDVLQRLSRYATKHKLILDIKDRSRLQQIKDKLKYVPDAAAITSLRSKLVYYYGSIQLLMTSVHNSSLERIEMHNRQVTADVKSITVQLDKLMLSSDETRRVQNAVPLLSGITDSDTRDALSRLFIAQAEVSETWQSIGLDTWLQCGKWWLVKAQSADLQWASAIGDHDVITQAYTNLLKSSWIFLDVLSVHPLIFSPLRGTQQLEIRQFSNTIKSRLQEFTAGSIISPTLSSIQKSDLTIWTNSIKQMGQRLNDGDEYGDQNDDVTFPSTGLGSMSRPFYFTVCWLSNGSIKQECLLELLYEYGEDWVARIVCQNSRGTIVQLYNVYGDGARPSFQVCTDHEHCFAVRRSDTHILFPTAFGRANFLAHYRTLVSLEGQIPNEYIATVGYFHVSMELHTLLGGPSDGLWGPRALVEILLPSQDGLEEQTATQPANSPSLETVVKAVAELQKHTVLELRKTKLDMPDNLPKPPCHRFCRLLWIRWISQQSAASKSGNWIGGNDSDALFDIEQGLLDGFRFGGYRGESFTPTAIRLRQWKLVSDIYSPLLELEGNEIAQASSWKRGLDDESAEYLWRAHYNDPCRRNRQALQAVAKRSNSSEHLVVLNKAWAMFIHTLFALNSLEDFDAELGSVSTNLPSTLRSYLKGSPAGISKLVFGLTLIRTRVANGDLPHIAAWFHEGDHQDSSWLNDWSDFWWANLEKHSLVGHPDSHSEQKDSFEFDRFLLMLTLWLNRHVIKSDLPEEVMNIAYKARRQYFDIFHAMNGDWRLSAMFDACKVARELEKVDQRTTLEERLYQATIGKLNSTRGGFHSQDGHEEPLSQKIGKLYDELVEDHQNGVRRTSVSSDERG